MHGKRAGAGAAIGGARWQHALFGDPAGMGWRRSASPNEKLKGDLRRAAHFNHWTHHECRAAKAAFGVRCCQWLCESLSLGVFHAQQVPTFGGKVDRDALALFCERVRAAVDFARTVEEVAWAPDAAQRWVKVYPELSEGKPGLFGQVTARAEAQTIRLALVCALLDKSAEIRLEHLSAALELWRYCADSAAFIFGNSLGDPLADAILEVLRTHPEGMTRTEINNHFGRNKTKAALDAAIATAQRNGSLRKEERETGGRVAEVLQLVSA